MKAAGKVLAVFGYIWLGGVVLLVFFGSASYVVLAEDKWTAFLDVVNQFSPFNVGYFLTVLLLALPGIGLMALGKRLRGG